MWKGQCPLPCSESPRPHSPSSFCQAWQPSPEAPRTGQLWKVTQSMGAARADVLIAWLKACRAVLLITVIHGFNLLNKSNVLPLCLSELSSGVLSLLPPQQVPVQVLAASSLLAQAPLVPGTCLPITMPAWHLPSAPWWQGEENFYLFRVGPEGPRSSCLKVDFSLALHHLFTGRGSPLISRWSHLPGSLYCIPVWPSTLAEYVVSYFTTAFWLQSRSNFEDRELLRCSFVEGMNT